MSNYRFTGRPKSFQDLAGKSFSYLTVESFAFVRGERSRHYYWTCRCICGSITTIDGGHLRNGHTKSCGCKTGELSSARVTRHGHCRNNEQRSLEHKTWTSMLQRCRDRNCKSYARYGAVGIIVCERWLEFSNFLADMGLRPSAKHSIDRKDNSLGYNPENCRWATPSQQRRNMQDSILVTFAGVMANLADHCEKHGIAYHVAYQRLNRLGWSIEETFTKPVRQCRQN